MQNKKDIFEKFNNLLNRQEYEKAEILLKKYLKQVNERDNKIFRIYLLLGWLYDQWALRVRKKSLRNKYQKKAKEYFKISVKNKNTKQEALRGIATVLMHQEKLSEALGYYKKAHSLKKDFDTHNDLGNIYRRLNKNNLSVSFYRKSFSLSENKEESSIPLFNLIIISRILNNQKEEKRYLEILKRLAKKLELAKVMLSRLNNTTN